MEQAIHRIGIRGLQTTAPQAQPPGMPSVRTPSSLRSGSARRRWAGVMLLAGYAAVCSAGSFAQGDAAAQDAMGEAAVPAAQDTAAEATSDEAAASASATQDTTGEEPVSAVRAIWKEQEIDFHFQSFTTFYSCSSLEDKIERILRELGARATVRVRDIACPFSVARMPRVRIHLRSPVEATPDALAEYEKGRSRRELVARVRGERAEESADMAQFPAVWKVVTLSRGSLELDAGDCELVRELRRKVFPKLAVRAVQDDTRCSPGQPLLGGVRVQMETLVELPAPDAQGVENPRPD